MRILIVFGSESDKSYYDPIHHKLKETHDVACEVISAHRNNLKLQQYLKDNQFDLIIAGAGIAAHLPGVVASLVKTPVIGLAVPAQYEGLDAFASILQMPYGIPVATTMADNLEQIEGFISRIEACKLDAYKSINLVLQSEQDWMARELDRSKVLLTDLGFEYTISSALKEDCINIALHTDDSQLEIADKVHANIPLIPAEKLHTADRLTEVFNWAKQAGIWFGTNNTRNAILYVSKLLRLSESLYFNAHYYLERKGSSKDLICKQGDKTHLYMGFTDRYSAFDWGEMPNAIPNKGKSQAEFTYNLYKLLEKADSWQDASFLSDIESTLSSETAQALQELKQSGVNHHMKDLIRYHDRPLIKAQAFDVRFPTFSQGEYDYTVYNSRPENTVIPLEVIFRFGIPLHSQAWRRQELLRCHRRQR